jgi:hypothetical protein
MIETIVCPSCHKEMKSARTFGLAFDTPATCKGCGNSFLLGNGRKALPSREEKDDEILSLIAHAETIKSEPKPVDDSDNRCRCPYCKESIIRGAIKCKHCGETIEKTYREFKQNQLRQTYNGVSAVLSLVIPGSGQVYKGQPLNGVAWLLTVPTCYVCFIPLGIVAHACCVFGASRP